MTPTKSYATFNAAEAAHVTGIDQVLQREWRRRGHLPPVASPRAKASFDSRELAQFYALGALSRAGIGPATANQLARSVGTLVLIYALERHGAVSDPEGLWPSSEPLIHLSPEHERMRWMVTGDGQSWSWTNDPAEHVQAYGVVTIVMDLERAADELVARARKPLLTIVPEEA